MDWTRLILLDHHPATSLTFANDKLPLFLRQAEVQLLSMLVERLLPPNGPCDMQRIVAKLELGCA